MSLPDVKALRETYLLDHGADSFWYRDIGAFVFAGNETAISVSGKDYKAAERVIQENDVITIDLSPQKIISGEIMRERLSWKTAPYAEKLTK